MNDRYDIDSIFEHSIDDAIGIFEQLPQCVVLILRHDWTGLRMGGKLLAPREDPFYDAEGILPGAPGDLGFDGFEISQCGFGPRSEERRVGKECLE